MYSCIHTFTGNPLHPCSRRTPPLHYQCFQEPPLQRKFKLAAPSNPARPSQVSPSRRSPKWQLPLQLLFRNKMQAAPDTLQCVVRASRVSTLFKLQVLKWSRLAPPRNQSAEGASHTQTHTHIAFDLPQDPSGHQDQISKCKCASSLQGACERHKAA